MVTSTSDFKKNATGKSTTTTDPKTLAEAQSAADSVASATQAYALKAAQTAWLDNTVTYKGYTMTGDKYKAIIASMLNVTKDVYCNHEMINVDNFLKDNTNWKSIVDAYIKLGLFYGNYVSSGTFRSSQCNTNVIMVFYNYAKQWASLSLKYPPIDITQKNNCYFLKEALTAFEAEKGNAESAHGLNSGEYLAVLDKISEYNAANSQMSCGKYIIDQNEAELQKQTDIINEKSNKQQIQNYKLTTTGSADNTTKYITYGAVGLAAVVFLVVLVKKMKKD